MNDNIIEAMKTVFRYASHIDEWIIVKKEMLKFLHPDDRKLFSTRDNVSRKQRTNEMEFGLIALWSEMTGRPVIINEDEKHKRQREVSDSVT
jgi:hypothetical protein